MHGVSHLIHSLHESLVVCMSLHSAYTLTALWHRTSNFYLFTQQTKDLQYKMLLILLSKLVLNMRSYSIIHIV